MTATIKKTIGIGDAGLPFDVSINVDYAQEGNEITVTHWMEDESPYDNPPDLWYKRMEEVIEDYFFDQDKNLNVIFK
jgi:hypothetical protein